MSAPSLRRLIYRRHRLENERENKTENAFPFYFQVKPIDHAAVTATTKQKNAKHLLLEADALSNLGEISLLLASDPGVCGAGRHGCFLFSLRGGLKKSEQDFVSFWKG